MAERGANTIPITNPKRLSVKNNRCALEANYEISNMKKKSTAAVKIYDKDMEEMKKKLLIERPLAYNGLFTAPLKISDIDQMTKNNARVLLTSTGSNTTKDNNLIGQDKILPPVNRDPNPGRSKIIYTRLRQRSRTISAISSCSSSTISTAPSQKSTSTMQSAKNTSRKGSLSTAYTKPIPQKPYKTKKKLIKAKTLPSVFPKDIETSNCGTFQLHKRVSLNVTHVYSTTDSATKAYDEASRARKASTSSMFGVLIADRLEMLVNKRPSCESAPDLVVSDKQIKESYEHVSVYQAYESDQQNKTVPINIGDYIMDKQTPTECHITDESSNGINLDVSESVQSDLIDRAESLAAKSNNLYPTEGSKFTFPTIVNGLESLCTEKVLGLIPDTHESKGLDSSSLNLAVKQMGMSCPYKDLL